MLLARPPATRTRHALATALTAVAMCAPANTASAQLLAALAPASCGAPPIPATASALADSALLTGVVVRLGIGRSDKPVDVYLAHAMSAAISAQLRRFVDVPVQARTGGQRAPAGNDTGGTSERAAAIAEGRVLGVQWVISGNVERRGELATVTWRAHDARTGAERSAGSMTSRVTLLDSLASEVAMMIAPRIGSNSTSTSALLRTTRTSVTAFDRLMEGLFYSESFNPTSWRRAETVLQQAVVDDSALLAAWQALAEIRLKTVRWGYGNVTSPGRSQRSAAAVTAAHRALALDNANPRSLALVARAHLLRSEDIPAQQALDGLRSVAPNDEAISLLQTEMTMLVGKTSDMDAIHSSSNVASLRNPDALFARAEWHRQGGRAVEACRTLNRILTLAPDWAPAAAMRAIVRAQLGDRRGAWIDAEVASRLGRHEWGTAAAALADVAAADTARARERLSTIPMPAKARPVPYFDALLNGAALLAVKSVQRAEAFILSVACEDPYRHLLGRDPLVAGASVVSPCSVLPSVGGP